MHWEQLRNMLLFLIPHEAICRENVHDLTGKCSLLMSILATGVEPLGSFVEVEPAVANGLVYLVGTRNGTLYAFHLPAG